MRRTAEIFYILLQWTYALPQTLLGLALLVRFRKCPRFYYRGAVVVVHDGAFGGVSLGVFVFVNGSRGEEWRRAATVHEYGHTLQSLLLGPLYLLIIGIPSAVWCNAPRFNEMRANGASYFDFYPEKWAEAWGEKATGEPSLSTLERRKTEEATAAVGDSASVGCGSAECASATADGVRRVGADEKE